MRPDRKWHYQLRLLNKKNVPLADIDMFVRGIILCKRG